MSSTMVYCFPSPNSAYTTTTTSNNQFWTTRVNKYSSLKQPFFSSNDQLLLRIPHHGSFKRTSIVTSYKPFSSPVMEWQDFTVKVDVDVPASVAYKCYSDRKTIPRWMPHISSVEIVEGKPNHQRYSLKDNAFGLSDADYWLGTEMQPIPNRKIQWKSLEGRLPNRGAVRFFPKGPSTCAVELTVSYDVPPLLSPVMQPLLQNELTSGMKRQNGDGDGSPRPTTDEKHTTITVRSAPINLFKAPGTLNLRTIHGNYSPRFRDETSVPGSVWPSTAILSETSPAKVCRLHLLRAFTKQQVSSFVFPSRTSTTNNSITSVPCQPSIYNLWMNGNN
ncbi:hypothetical protein ACFE04_019281 [Oxalis oulophora]